MKAKTIVQNTPQIAMLFLLVCLALAGAAYAADEADAEPVANSAYVSIGKPLVLNLSGARRLTFLQIGADVLVADDSAEDLVKLHLPAIRHDLILLLSEQPATDLKSPARREELRQQATARVKGLIAELSGSDDVAEVLFSEVLVQ